MLRVTIFPSRSSAHLSQVFAGLYELEAAGIVDLSASGKRPDWGDAAIDDLLYLEVSDARTTTNRRVVVDVRDGSAVDASAVARADFYFKRTFDHLAIAGLPNSSKGKVQPFGLNYACSSDKQLRNPTFARQLYASERTYGNQRTFSKREADAVTTLRRRVGLPLRWLGLRRDENSPSARLPFGRFEAGADVPARSGVLFLTRLWSPTAAPGFDLCALRELNTTRIELVRILRHRFGDRFIGGVQCDEFSERYCPDCLTDLGASKRQYLNLMKTHLIGVASTGLHGSIGWKLAEYVAASRCVVSEPLRWGLPEPFVAGANYLEYRSPEQCADACERILDSPALSASMRHHNENYYRRALKPDSLMLRHLQFATKAGNG